MRVLDLSQQLPGPYATLLLASLGATVVKVEPPAGDAARDLDPAMFNRVNVGKTSLTLNLKNAADQQRLLALVPQFDVLVEGFRPGVTQRLGCDYATVSKLRPSLIYCSISGFGQDGPMASHPSHDLTMQAMVGALANPIEIDRIGVPWVDLGTGTTAALAIAAYWHAGQGIYLDLAMLDTASAWASIKPQALTEPEPTYGTFEVRDGGRVAIALLEDSMWVRLCAAFGWADWHDVPEVATYRDRRVNADLVRDRLRAFLAQLTMQEVRTLASEHDLPIEPADATGIAEVQEQLSSRSYGAVSDWRRGVPLPNDLIGPLGPAPEN